MQVYVRITQSVIDPIPLFSTLLTRDFTFVHLESPGLSLFSTPLSRIWRIKKPRSSLRGSSSYVVILFK